MNGGRFTHPPESRPLEGYTLKRAIHRGGFGEVYYGLSDGGKEVALKLLHQHTEVELRGANACLNLNHPNLVTIFDIKRDGAGDWWVLMEYAGGPRLADVLEDRGKLPVEEIERWLRGLTAGLTFLHERGLVHRDLKPANIFAEGGTVKVGDVGLSKFISESRGSEHTKSVGTVYYMAPEVARGRYGRGVDVYALAVMLFEMYTGTVPFDGETPAEILMKHLSAPPDLAPLPPALRPVFARALHKDPAQRTRSAAELERQFRAAVRGQAVAGRAVGVNDEPLDLKPASFAVPVTRTGDARTAETWPGDTRAGADTTRHAPPPALPADTARPAHKAEPKRDRVAAVLKWAAVAALVLAVVSPRALRGLTAAAWELAILGALGYGVFRGVKWLAGGKATPTEPPAPTPAGERLASPYAVPVRTAARRHAPRPVPLGPEDARPLSGWRRTTEFAGSAAVAGLLSAAVAGVMAATGAVESLAGAALFGAVTALAGWGVLLTSKLTEGRFRPGSRRAWVRRYPSFAVGALTGLAAWGLGELLLVAVPWEGASLLGTLTAARPSETVPPFAWVGFFTMLLGLRRWWRHADGYRPKRLRVRTVLLTTAVGLGGCLIFGVPAQLALPWAVAISVVTQLSAVWTPRRKRPHVVSSS